MLGKKRKSAEDPQVVKVYTTNPDLLWADAHPEPRLGPLVITIMIKECFKEVYGYDLEIEQFGKPTEFTYNYVEKHLRQTASNKGVEISNFYMIGDNPESDIAGAIKKGWTSILVKTGVFDPDAKTSVNGNDSKFPATYVVEDFAEAIDLIFRLEALERVPLPPITEQRQQPITAG